MVLTLDEFLKANEPDKPNKDISIKANVYIYNSEDDYIQGKPELGHLDNVNFPRNLSRMRNFLNKKIPKTSLLNSRLFKYPQIRSVKFTVFKHNR